MKILDWLKKFSTKHDEDNLENTQEKISQMRSKMEELKVLNVFDTVQRESSLLINLKDSIYNQDQKRIKNLIELFDQLDSQQLEIVKKVNQIKKKISETGVQKGKKQSVNNLIKRLETAAKNFDEFVKENRTSIEKIKRSIKDNDFDFAERLINDAINREQDLRKKAIEIENLENQIKNKLII
jgi:hypothetical protein